MFVGFGSCFVLTACPDCRYRDRFCRAMERYFVCVPDKFTQPNALVSNAAEPHGDAKPILDEEALHEDSKEKEETIATTSSS